MALYFRLGGVDRSRKSGILVGGELARLTSSAVHGVTQPLRCGICLPPRAQHFEPEPALVERLLRNAPGSIELGSHTIPQRHRNRLAVRV